MRILLLTTALALIAVGAEAQTDKGNGGQPPEALSDIYDAWKARRQNNNDSVFHSSRPGEFVVGSGKTNNPEQSASSIDMIKGRVPGMTVERNGSNALSSVRLRGTTSLTGGNDPLIIVDGVIGRPLIARVGVSH